MTESVATVTNEITAARKLRELLGTLLRPNCQCGVSMFFVCLDRRRGARDALVARAASEEAVDKNKGGRTTSRWSTRGHYGK